MIDLRIDGTSIAVAESQTICYEDCNSLFDAAQGKGSYTYDIDIDLNVPVNARMYRHLDRIAATNIPTGRTAEMFVDGRRIFAGSETLLRIEGKLAKIQVLCGNSKINFSGNDTRMSELDLGMLPNVDYARALEANSMGPGQAICVYPPVMLKFDSYPYNEDAEKFANFVDKDTVWDVVPAFQQDTELIGQPYLLYVVRKVLEALGWKIGVNSLNSMEYAKRMIIVHGHRSLELCKILPNWTVSEFLYEIQKLFNVIFIADDLTGIVDIYNINQYYGQVNGFVYIDRYDVIDYNNTVVRSLEEGQSFAFNYDKVSYNKPAVRYYNRAGLDDEIVALCEEVSVPDFFEEESTYRISANYNKPLLFTDDGTGSSWMLVRTSPTGTLLHWERVQQFKRAFGPNYSEDSDETTLKIVPAEVLCLDVHPKDEQGRYYNSGATVVYARNQDVEQTEDEETEEKGLNEWVEGDLPKDVDTRNDSLFVAQYLGYREILWDHKTSSEDLRERYESQKYPMCAVTKYINGILHAEGSTRRTVLLKSFFHDDAFGDNVVFDLDKRIRDIYANNEHINEKQVFRIKYRSNGRQDVRKFYVIDGRRFVCVKNEYTIENGHLSPVVLGTFLPFD